MTIKSRLKQSLREIEEAQTSLRRAKYEAPENYNINRAITELEDAVIKIKKAVRELPEE